MTFIISWQERSNLYIIITGNIKTTSPDGAGPAKITGTKTNNDYTRYKAVSGLINMACTDLDTKIKTSAANVRLSDAFQNEINLDAGGKIIGKNLRGEDLDNKPEELFGKN